MRYIATHESARDGSDAMIVTRDRETIALINEDGHVWVDPADRWVLISNEVDPGTVDMETATCVRCGREITWEFDNELEPYGLWRSEETLDSCTPGPNDEDRWHTPAPSEVVYGVLNAHMFGTATEPGEHVDWSTPDYFTEETFADWLEASPVEYAEANQHMIVFEALS